MKKRIEYASNQLLAFSKNPYSHYKNTNDNYAQLLDIATITSLLSIFAILFSNNPDGYGVLVFFIVGVLLARLAGWLLLNFYGLVFDYYIDKIVFKKFISLESELLSNLRIVTYASIASIIRVLPIPFIGYAAFLLSAVLTYTGLKARYELTDKQAYVTSGVFVFTWMLIWQLVLILIAISYK